MQNQMEIVNMLPFVVVLIPLFTAISLTAVGPKQGLKVTAFGNILSF